MKVAVVRNSDRTGVINRFGRPCPEKYGHGAIQNVVSALEHDAHDVLLCEGDKNLLSVLEGFMPADAQGQPGGMVFNMAYGIQGDARYTHVPAMLEMAGVPYTGAGPLGHALALDKVITKELLRAAGVPTPNYQVMRHADDFAGTLTFPVIVKPRHESTSFGLQLVSELAQLRAAVDSVVAQYQQDALVEEYIEGREVCVALLGNEQMEWLPLVEHDFGARALHLVTKNDKFHQSGSELPKLCPPNMSRAQEAALQEIAYATFRACHCRDYARVDIRIDMQGNPFVLEINSMASLGSGGSYVLAAMTAGYTMNTLVNRILQVAHARSFALPERADIVTRQGLLTGWADFAMPALATLTSGSIESPARQPR
jgi:D-alanine-D-alanine ligase